MLKKTYLFSLLLCLAFSLISAQNSFDVEVQGKRVSMPENIQNFTWDTFPKTAQVATGYFGWIQFYKTPSQEIQDSFKKGSTRLIEYIGNKTYLAYFPKGTSAAALKNKGVRSLVPVDWETKVHLDLRNGDIPNYAKRGENLLVTVVHYKGLDRNKITADLLAQKIIVDQQYKGANVLELSIPNNCLEELAKRSYIKWIEFIAPPSVKEDTRGRSIHKSNSLDTQSGVGNNFTGDGIGVLVRDDGIVGPHIDFQGRINNDSASGTGQTHGDGVAGILAGAGNLDPTKRGMAAGSDVFVSNYASSFLDAATTNLINSGQVQITNSSYGDGCNGGYTSRSNTVDTQANNNLSLLHVFSAGNSGTSNCGYGAGAGWGNITGGHKQGKNVIATANVFYQGNLASSSSKGPAYDGRIKPDITAHGQGQLSTNENNAYLSFGGTSGAAPGVAGVSAQLYELYGDNNGGALPQSALIKATLLNTANDYGNVGPDFNFGWGLINGRRAGMLIENDNYLSATISQGGANNHTINVPAGTTQVKIMLYWNDPAATAGASTALINDLDLTVTDANDNSFQPYILDPTPNAATLDLPATTGIDRLNNMEQVVINTPLAGDYQVDISGFDVPVGPQEYFVVYDLIQEELTLTYPNGSESFVPGDTETIHWDAVNTSQNFTLEYSVDNGNSWTVIAIAPSSATNLDWNVPSQITGEALIRVTSGAFQDVSDNTYAIASQPNNFQFLQVCPTQVNFTWDAVNNAEEYDVYLLGEETMEVETTVTDAFATVTIPNGEDSIWAAIVAKNNTLGWESRRTFAINNTGLLNCNAADDVGISIMNDPSDFSSACEGTDDVIVSVRLSNFGTEDQTNFDYSYQLDTGTVVQDTYTGTLTSGNVVDVDFVTPVTISSNDSYTLNASVSLTGDENPNNDNDTLDFYAFSQATALDVTEDFESNGFTPLGWSIVNSDNSNTWLENNSIGSDGNTSTMAFINNANYNASGQEDIFVTEYYDLNGVTGSQLSFDLAKAQWSSAFNDALRVDVSIDCGATFTTIYEKDGLDLATVEYIASSWSPSGADDWREEVIDLIPFQNEIVQFRFVNVNGYSNNTYIDNISLEGSSVGNTPPTASSFTVQNGAYEGLTHTFATADFGYSDVDNDEMDSLIIEVIPSEGTLYVDANGNDMLDGSEAIADDTIVLVADINNGNLQYIQNGIVNTSFQFEVSDGTEESTGDYIATINIIPKPTVTLSQDLVAQDEASTTPSIITAQLSGIFGADVQVNITLSGSATLDTDYAVTSNTILVSQGSTSGTIQLNNIDDSDDESNETVIITITSIVNGTEDGVQQLTYTITDDDEAAPVAVCQDITVNLDETGVVTILPGDIDNGSSAASGIDTMSLDITEFTCAAVGDNVVTLTVTDNNGNTASCMATVTVQDVVAPTVICQNITVALDTNGIANITAADVDNGSTDTCGIDSLSLDTTQFTCAEAGDNTVTLTVTDANGNTATCTAIVTVEDTIEMTVNGPSNFTVQTTSTDTGCETIVTYDAVSGSDNCDEDQIIVVQTEGLGSGALFPVGTTTETYEITDADGAVTVHTFDVEVTDGTNPEMVGGCPDNSTETVEEGEAFEIPDYSTIMTVEDNCDDAPVFSQVPAPGVLVQPGTTTTVVLTAVDATGNETTCSFSIAVDENLSISDSELSAALQLYPNPVDNNLHISYTGVEELKQATVYDVAGKRVKEFRNASQMESMSLQSVASGVYFVKINTDKSQTVKRIIKN